MKLFTEGLTPANHAFLLDHQASLNSGRSVVRGALGDSALRHVTAALNRELPVSWAVLDLAESYRRIKQGVLEAAGVQRERVAVADLLDTSVSWVQSLFRTLPPQGVMANRWRVESPELQGRFLTTIDLGNNIARAWGLTLGGLKKPLFESQDGPDGFSLWHDFPIEWIFQVVGHVFADEAVQIIWTTEPSDPDEEFAMAEQDAKPACLFPAETGENGLTKYEVHESPMEPDELFQHDIFHILFACAAGKDGRREKILVRECLHDAVGERLTRRSPPSWLKATERIEAGPDLTVQPVSRSYREWLQTIVVALANPRLAQNFLTHVAKKKLAGAVLNREAFLLNN